MDSRGTRTQISWRDERQKTNTTSMTCAIFLKILAVSELIRGCYAYQSMLPNSFSGPQQRTQQPTWPQPYHHYHQQSHQPLHMAQRRRPSVETYDDYYNEEDDDDDYWPEPLAEKQESPKQVQRPLGYAPGSEATINREKKIQSNPNMDFRNVEEKPLNDPIQQYNGNARRPRNIQSSDLDSYYDDEDEDDEDYYYDDDDEEEDNDDAGNFWSNPPARYDPIQQPKRRVPRDNEPAPARTSRSRRPPRSSNERRPGSRRKKSTFRSGTPKPPAVVEDIYNQLFWYGFDPADTTSPADKTMFGGTKGKFNGLAFLDSTLDPKPPMMMENRSGPRQRKIRERRDDYYDDDEDYDDYEPQNRYGEEETFSDTLERISRQDKPARSARVSSYDDDDDDYYYSLYSQQRRPPSKRFELRNNDVIDDDDGESQANDKIYFVTPPNDQPRIRMDDMKASDKPPERRKRRPRQSPWEEGESGRNSRRRRNNEEDYEDGSLQRASKKVSNWFRDDEDDYETESRGRSGGTERERRPGRRRKSAQASWVSPLEVVGNLLGLDNEPISYQAEMYNRQMGLGPRREKNGRSRNGSRRPERQGRGYAYHYEVDTSEYDTILDADIVETDNDTETKSQITLDRQEVEIGAAVVGNVSNEAPATSKTAVDDSQTISPKKANWEERALAMERIPPPDIPAWGPSGDLGMDARMKATIDALQDIQEAQNKLKQRKQREQQATDDITILKVDVGVKKRRMAANRQEARMLREDIRNLELDIEDASRTLRKARDQVQFAQDRLAELEDRHWALIGLYNPDQAKEKVEEALQEFVANEPAARGRVKDVPVDGVSGD